jgi:hypothetical protein
MWPRRRKGGSIFVDDVSPRDILTYIHRFHVTDGHIPIFLNTEEYKELYSSALRSSVISSVNREIYAIFLDYTVIFVKFS